MLFVNSGMAAAAGEGFSGKTYADFVAHIAELATSGEIAWIDEVYHLPYVAGSRRKHRTTRNFDFSGPLYGSPAGGRFIAWSSPTGGNNRVARIIQHALPDGDLSGAVLGRELYFEVLLPDMTKPAFVSRTVNEYTSNSYPANQIEGSIVDRVIWWDGSKAMWRNPSALSAPQPYTW